MTFLKNITKNIFSGLAMQHAGDYLSDNNKQAWLKEAKKLNSQECKPEQSLQEKDNAGVDIGSAVLSRG